MVPNRVAGGFSPQPPQHPECGSAPGVSLNPNAKVFVKIGTLHTLKKLDWQDYVPNKRLSIRKELKELLPSATVFSIANIIDQKPGKCDFSREFGLMDAVAVDCDDRFLGWKAGFLSVIAIKPAEVCDLIDGLIIY